MNWWQKERKAQKKELRERALLDILINEREGLLQIRASLLAGKKREEAYKESIQAVEIVHSACQKLVAINREEGKNEKYHLVLSCGCGLRLEFPPDAIVNTVGDLDRELERQDKKRNLKNQKD